MLQLNMVLMVLMETEMQNKLDQRKINLWYQILIETILNNNSL